MFFENKENKMEKEEALELWDVIYGKGTVWATDCFGTWMCRDDYGDTEKKSSPLYALKQN